MIIAPILPRVAVELQVAESALGTLITAYAVAVAVFALVTGPISDTLGRWRILLGGTAIMAVALVLHGLVWDFASFLGARLAAGVAGGILAGAAVAYAGDYFSQERRGWANGWVMSGLAAGQIAGIPIGTVLAAWFGFRAPFLAFALVMATTCMLIWTVLPRLPVSEDHDPLSIRTAFEGYRELLHRTEILAATVAFALMFLGTSLYIAYLPTWLESSWGVTGTAIATLFFIGGVGNVLAGPRAGDLSDTVGRKRVIIGASLGLSLAMLVTLLVTSALWAIYALFFVVMALLASRASPFQAFLADLVSDERRGSLMSLTMAVGQVGFGLGGALAGPLYVGTGYTGNVVAAAATGIILAALAWRYFPTVLPSSTADIQPSSQCVDYEQSRGTGQDALCGPLPEGGHGKDSDD